MTAWGITECMRSERKNSFGISPHLFGIRRRGGRLDPLCANRFKCHWLDGQNAAGRAERLGSRYSRGLESGGASGPPFHFSLGEIPWPRASSRAIIRSTSSPTRRGSRCPTAARGTGQRAALLRRLRFGVHGPHAALRRCDASARCGFEPRRCALLRVIQT